MAKMKKNRQPDFQKIKLKVGKKLKKANNVTNTSFKTRSIQITQKMKSLDGSVPCTKKKQNIWDLFSNCRNLSGSVRMEALNGLRELVSTNSELILLHLSDLVEKSSELLIDKDPNVRQASLRLLKSFLPKTSEKQLSSFFPLLCAHLCCAMTHIFDDIQRDSLLVLDLLLDVYPKLMIQKSIKVLSNFIEQISKQHCEGHSKRSLSANPSSSTSTLKWRVSVLNRLQKFLTAILSVHGDMEMEVKMDVTSNREMTSNKELIVIDKMNAVQIFPEYVTRQWDLPGFTISSFGKDTDNRSDDIYSKFQEFTATLIPLLIECWVEAAPSKNLDCESGSLIHVENLGMMNSILQVIQLVLECSSMMSDKEGGTQGTSKYVKEFEQHFLANFPYCVHTDTAKHSKKLKLDAEQVSAEMLNLTICEVMTKFLEGIATNQEAACSTWLKKVTLYLEDFLKGKYSRGTVAWSAKRVVKILERLQKSYRNGYSMERIIKLAFHKYSKANMMSKEKRTYLKFFADLVHDSIEGGDVGPEIKSQFLNTLPALLPICAKDNPQMAALVIDTIKTAVCQNCSNCDLGHYLQNSGADWFDSNNGVMHHLSLREQHNLIGLLYYVPQIRVETRKLLMNLVRSCIVQEQEVAFLIQVLQNRYSHKFQQVPEEATLLIEFLCNLILGVSTGELSCVDDHGQQTSVDQPWFGTFKIIKNQDLEAEASEAFQRHNFLVEMTSIMLKQFPNTEQVTEIIGIFLQKVLSSSSTVVLEMAYGICKFVEQLTYIPISVFPLLANLSISLLYHLVAWNVTANQNKGNTMIGIGCSLVLKVEGGLESMLILLRDVLLKGVLGENLNNLMRLVLIFLTEGRQESVKTKQNCLQLLVELKRLFKINVAALKTDDLESVPFETSQLMANMDYLLDQLI